MFKRLAICTFPSLDPISIQFHTFQCFIVKPSILVIAKTSILRGCNLVPWLNSYLRLFPWSKSPSMLLWILGMQGISVCITVDFPFFLEAIHIFVVQPSHASKTWVTFSTVQLSEARKSKRSWLQRHAGHRTNDPQRWAEKIGCSNIYIYMGMDQYLLIPFLGGWTSK